MIATDTKSRFDDARRAMIDSQLRTSGVNEPFVLARMGTVAREDFVPAEARAAAYTDRAIRLPEGGALPAPLFHGKLLAEAKPTREDRVVVVDGGSGYLAELLRPMVASLEVVGAADAAEGKIASTDATLLLVDGALEHIPEALAARLPEGAKVVTGLVERGITRLAIGRKVGATLGLVALAELGAPRLAAFDRKAGWSF